MDIVVLSRLFTASGEFVNVTTPKGPATLGPSPARWLESLATRTCLL